MKRQFIIFISLIFLIITQNAYCTWGLKIGGNYSFLKELSYGEPGVGYLYGIGKDWHLYRWLQLRSEVLISTSTTLLKDRSVQNGCDSWQVMNSFPHLPPDWTGYTDIRYYDINIKVSYFDIPLLLKVDRIIRKDLSIGLEMGYSLKFLRKDCSENTFLRKVKSTDLTEEERQSFRFDYRITKLNEDYSYHGRGLCPTIGIYANYSRLQVSLRYQVDYIDWVSEIVIGEDLPLRIFSLSMGCRF